jgi:rhamnosyltransferase
MERAMRPASILIRTLNEEAALAATLQTVFAQSVAPHEVFVIDSGSADATLEIAARYPVRIVEIPPEEWSYPRALNRGAERATGEILVCLSAHAVPSGTEWLSNLLRHFDDPRVAAVWGPSLRLNRSTPLPAGPLRQEHGSYTVETRTWGLSNSNSALRRSLWELCPFDERLPGAEDKAWGREMMARGYCIVFDPAAATTHARHTAKNAYRRNRAAMEGFLLMFPELQRPAAGSWSRVARAALRIVRRYAARPYPWHLWRDIKQGVSTLASVVGGYAGSRRARRSDTDGERAAGPPLLPGP